MENEPAKIDSVLTLFDSAIVNIPSGSDSLEDAVEWLAELSKIKQDLDESVRQWQVIVGGLMSEKEQTVGKWRVKRSKDKSRRNWQSDDLLRTVLDTRHVDPETGEAESQIDILKACYGMYGSTARLSALRERGIDEDQFCQTEDRGWTARIRF